MAADKVTITGKTGPGSTVTSLVLNNIRGITFDFDAQIVSVREENNKVKNFDLFGTTTVTYSVTTHTATIAISQ